MLPDNKWLEKDELLKIWKSWGGKTRVDCNRDSRDPFKPQGIKKGKKCKLIFAIKKQPVKHQSLSGPAGEPTPIFPFIPLQVPSALTSYSSHFDPTFALAVVEDPIDSISLKPISIAEILYNHQLSKLEYDECKSSFLVKSCLLNSRSFFTGRLFGSSKELLDISILVDSGASPSFIDQKFVEYRGLTTNLLSSPLRIKSFDGLAAISGDVEQYISASILIPLTTGKFLKTSVCLFVTRLSLADAIFGNSWLKASNTFIGGVHNSIVGNGCVLFNSEIHGLTGNYLLKRFLDVYVTNSLDCLPPHRDGFDCEINLKPDSTSPFGRMYNLSKPEQDNLRKYVLDNLKKGFIRVSSSPVAAPIFYVKVAGKDDCPCVDYRLINDMTIQDPYPLPVISHLLNNLHGCKFLSKIDLKAAFNLLRIAPGHKWKTTF